MSLRDPIVRSGKTFTLTINPHLWQKSARSAQPGHARLKRLPKGHPHK